MNDGDRKPNLNFLFVTGCARSGTTEIVNVLNRHPAVAVGMERFKYVIRDRFEDYRQSLFEPANFLKAEEADTNILPRSPTFKNHFAMLNCKFDTGRVRFIGDKLPFLFRHYEAIEDRFSSPKWIIMHRSPRAVAASYCRRARNPADKGWTEERDHRMAVRHWVEAYRLMQSMLKEFPDRVHVCEYERFYSGDEDSLAQIFDFLELAVSPEVEAYFRETTADWDQREKRGVELTPDETQYVDNSLSQEEGIVFTSPSGMGEDPHL
jgi:hypothetical protein